MGVTVAAAAIQRAINEDPTLSKAEKDKLKAKFPNLDTWDNHFRDLDPDRPRRQYQRNNRRLRGHGSR
jgi:hypothetical protein